VNIWYMHPTAGGPGLGRHWRPYWLADAWNGMGHRASVVSTTSHHLMRGGSRPPGQARLGSVDYWFVDVPAYRDNSWGRLRNNAVFGQRLVSDAEEMARRFGVPDLIVASTPHLFHVPAARRIARRFGAKFWVEVRDLWPESLVALGLAPRWHPLVILMAMQERHAYRSAERLLSLLAGAEPHMRRRGLAENRFVWIPNGVSEADIDDAVAAPALDHPMMRHLQALRGQGRQVVIYAGAMGPPNALEVILAAARRLLDADPRVHFILIGEGIARQRLQSQARALANLEFANEVERPVVHGLLREADCAVIALRRSALYRHGISPNKLFDYCLFAPRMVVACEAIALAGLKSLVHERCEPEDGGELASSIAAALAGPPRPLEERIAAVGKFSYARLAKRCLADREGAERS
jgi:glycosyltransferase involved in cell wall biosynthesis